MILESHCSVYELHMGAKYLNYQGSFLARCISFFGSIYNYGLISW